MWVKTRAGLTAVPEPSEIVLWRSPDRSWMIYAMVRVPGRKSWLGRSELQRVTFVLACFRDRPGAEPAIGRVFAALAAAIEAKAPLCDLSTLDDANAWPEKWPQILWPQPE
jgi:hypothetical protein